MEKVISLIIDIDEKDELLCANCFSKEPTGSGSGRPDYRCRVFKDGLKEANKQENQVSGFGDFPLTKRCSDCLLITNTKKKFMAIREIS